MEGTAPALAKRYGCSIRTIWRMKAQGVDVTSDMDVTLWVLDNPRSTVRMIEAVKGVMEASPSAGDLKAGWKQS